MADDGLFEQRVRESLAVQEKLLDGEHKEIVLGVARDISAALRRGGKIILFGNGGSAADAQHIAAEFLGRFLLERAALPAISLSDNSSTVTCLSNDYDFERVFARQIEAFGEEGDVAFGISTSGNSENVLSALRTARERGLVTVALTGGNGGRMPEHADHCIVVPSDETPRIQEGHTLVAHIVCELVEREVAGAAADG